MNCTGCWSKLQSSRVWSIFQNYMFETCCLVGYRCKTHQTGKPCDPIVSHVTATELVFIFIWVRSLFDMSTSDFRSNRSWFECLRWVYTFRYKEITFYRFSALKQSLQYVLSKWFDQCSTKPSLYESIVELAILYQHIISESQYYD